MKSNQLPKEVLHILAVWKAFVTTWQFASGERVMHEAKNKRLFCEMYNWYLDLEEKMDNERVDR